MLVTGALLLLTGAGLFAASRLRDASSMPSRTSPAGRQPIGEAQIERAVVHLEDASRAHPRELRLRTGDGLRLQVENSSTSEHHFIVDGLGVHRDVEPGSTAQVVVSELSKGSYRSWCSVGHHGEHVTLVVS